MDLIYAITGIAVIASLIADRDKTIKSLQVAVRKMIKIVPDFLTMTILVSIVLCLGAAGVVILLIAHARRAINMIRFSGILTVLILGRFRLLRLCGWADCE